MLTQQHYISSRTFNHSSKLMLPQKRNVTHSDQESPSFNLDRVLHQFATQPELLELILSSKVEEDRRRAEEAKLKQKEIDYVIQQQKKTDSKDTTRTFSGAKRRLSTGNDHQQQLPSISPLAPRESPTTTSILSSSSSTSSWPSHQQRSSSSIEWRSSSIILPPLTYSPPSQSPTLFKHTIRSASPKRLSESSSDDDETRHQSMIMDHQPHPHAPPSPPNEPLSSTTITKRRRREMQAITTIIETKEFPYNDDYLWRNNGNTIHRKSGNKSIYYKCANSQKGCPVNKTCTLRQETGEYLIKYRGTHLPDCCTIKRINEV